MQAVKDRDTGPEMAVRRLVHGMGYRYRLHRRDLPGKSGFGVRNSPEGDFRAWLFLASSR